MPFSDEYGGTKSPWCITDAVKGEAIPDYACNEINCYMERVMDTEDTLKDFKISPDAAANTGDTLEI